MNACVKKEIRLLLSAWVAVLTLVLILPWFWKDPDVAIGVVPALLFFGMIILSVSSFGREFSQGTFLSLLSQPIERREIWRTKIAVLFVGAALTVAVGLAGSALRLETALAYGNSIWATNITLIRDDFRTSMFASVAVVLVALTSGLWTTLLLRQITTALWISVLMPAAVLALIGVVMSQMFASASDAVVETVIYCAAAIYFVLTFWLSRRLFYRAQDVGWSGGEITLPEWKWLGTNSTNANLPRKRKPIFALLKKEFQLQQVSMAGAAGLFVLHLGVIAWRGVHTFEKDSLAEALASIFWVLWLIIPVVIGCMAMAEERRLGVIEGQLCLPVSRRLQFIVKGFSVLIVGTLLGGVLPVILETRAVAMGLHSQVFDLKIHNGEFGLLPFELSIVALSAGLALVSLFASSLARNFLQAIGYAIATVVVCSLIAAELTGWRGIFLNSISSQTILPVLLAVPTIVALLLWLAYLNFKNFRDGWRLLRRTILGFAGAFVFIVVMSIAIYNRAWEVFQPAEPAHRAAKLSLANLPGMRNEWEDNLLVTLPDGRIWQLLLSNQLFSRHWKFLLAVDVLPTVSDQGFLIGSNWSSVIVLQFTYPFDLKAVGIQKDGSLWFFRKTRDESADTELIRLGNETKWRQLGRSAEGLLLLSNDGALWRWDRTDWSEMRQNPNFKLTQVTTNSDWKELFNSYPVARKADGSVWVLPGSKGKQELLEVTNLEQTVFQTLSFNGQGSAFVRPDGTLWAGNFEFRGKDAIGYWQIGTATNWVSVAVSINMMIALKSDGTLWKWEWNLQRENLKDSLNQSPVRLGIHSDWVAICRRWESVVGLAADGSLWLWPDRGAYEYEALLKLPKQPKFLGNVLGKTD